VPPAASFLQKARQKTLNKGFLRTTLSHARCEHVRAEQGLRELFLNHRKFFGVTFFSKKVTKIFSSTNYSINQNLKEKMKYTTLRRKK